MATISLRHNPIDQTFPTLTRHKTSLNGHSGRHYSSASPDTTRNHGDRDPEPMDENQALECSLPNKFGYQSQNFGSLRNGMAMPKDFFIPYEQAEVKAQAAVKARKPTQVNYSNMYELIPGDMEPEVLNNWIYPECYLDANDFPHKEPEDLPHVIRWVDVFVREYEKVNLKGRELAQFLERWQYFNNHDDVRYPYAYSKGGKTAENPKVISKLRVIAKNFVLSVGKHLLSGNTNLTAVPFPITAMIAKSYLEYVGSTPTSFFPLYMNLAMKTTDPLQRFKFYMVANICYFHLTSSFGKPLNPILGETMTGHYNDGSKVYLEQISHHPPVSYVYYVGPNDAYKFWGPSLFEASAGLNSLTIITKGWRKIQFKDTKQVIQNTFPNEHYDGTFFGTCTHESIGNMEFKDEANKIYCKVVFGKVKKRPSDYFEGTIQVNGKPVSKINGTYLGWTEIDGVRYFDHLYCNAFEMQKEKAPLASDFQYRPDLLTLELGYFDKAQKEKELLEHKQRTDAKLRKQHKEKKSKRAS